MQLYCQPRGSGERVLLLLHGMACNAAVWNPLIEIIGERWPGRILAPDLRGHGRSPHARHYGFGHHAADVAGLLQPGERVSVVAHSMGTVVALAAASGWFGISVEAILGFGVKVHFSDADTEKSLSLARSPVRWFDSREEAVERCLRFSGLKGLASPQDEVVRAGVREEGGRWRVAFDPGIFSAVGPSFEDVLRAAKTRLHLACGSEDAMVRIEELRRFDPEAVELPGRGHNFHVEVPQALAELMDRLL